MKINKLILPAFVFFGALALVLTNSCTKNSNPPPPVHDTVTIIKNDTTRLTDTLVKKIDTPDIKTGLVLYLPFNGSIADSSGLKNTVTSVGGAGLGIDRAGWPNSAFNSAGSGQYLTVANNGSYAVDTAFTVAVDFMIRNYATYYGGGNYSGMETLLSIVNNANGNGPTFDVGFCDPTYPQLFVFDVNSSQGSDCNSTGGSNPNNFFDTTTFVPQLNTWYNAVCTFSHGVSSVYINGQLIHSKKAGTDSVLFCLNATFNVGAWWNGTENLNGALDEVRFYNRVLTTNQIAWLSRNFQVNSNKRVGAPANGKGSRLN